MNAFTQVGSLPTLVCAHIRIRACVGYHNPYKYKKTRFEYLARCPVMLCLSLSVSLSIKWEQ